MKLFSLILCFLMISNIVAQEIKGRYEGAVSREGSVQMVNLDFFVEGGIQKATYEIPEIGYYKVPVDTIYYKEDTLNISFYYGKFLSVYNEESKEITGISEKWNPKIYLHLKLKDNYHYKNFYGIEEVQFSNNEIILSGMIFTPNDNEKNVSKYVVLVHGSGAQDRNSPYYISLAHRLAKSGIGVLLYDKRGTGRSSGDFQTSNMGELAADAAKAADYLHSRKDLNIAIIGLLGTSQGGWVAPLARKYSQYIDFLILNVGPAVSVYEQDIHRVRYSLKADGWKDEAIDSAVSFTKAYFKYAQSTKMKDWKVLQKLIPQVKLAEWSYIINVPQDKDDFKWWRRNNYDPKQTLENLDIPILSLFGELDPLVPPSENVERMRNYLGKAGVDFKIVVIPGAVHDMKTFQGLTGEGWDWPSSYWQWRKQPENFLNEIISFIKNVEHVE